MNELLPIFSDDDFVSHAYLDALFQEIAQKEDGIDLTSPKDLNSLQSTTLMLLNQLDFLTNEVTSELEENVRTLENTNSIISYSYQSNNNALNHTNVDSNLKPTSRLEYYIDSLSLGIDSLNHEVTGITDQLLKKSTTEKETEEKQPSKMKSLLTLSKSKENLQQVLKALNTIKSIIDIAQTLDDSSSSTPTPSNNSRVAPTSTKSTNKQGELIKVIKPDEFQLAVNVLKETIIEQFDLKLHNESEEVIDYEFLTKINDLVKINEVFKNFGRFYSIYNNLTSFLNTEQKNYLSRKKVKVDTNEEFFNKALN